MGKYESLKQASCTWLGSIPSHWQELFLEQVAREKCVKNSSNSINQVLSLSYGNIKIKKDLNKGLIAKDLSTYQIVKPGDIIMRLTDLQNDHKSLRTGLVNDMGIITSAYLCLVPKIDSKYLYYLLHSYDTQKVFYGMGGGVRQSIGFKDIRHMYFPVPPRAEQEQIVRFLDWKVSEINKLIGIKKTYILNIKDYEKKLINDKVLHGLHNEKKKFSGNKLIGEIPNTWNILCLGRFCSFQNGISESSDFFTSGTPFVGYGDVYRHIELPSHVSGTAKASEKQQKLFSVQKDDIFFTRTSENIEEIGMSAVCSHTIDKAIFSGFLIRCRQKEKRVISDYMKYYLQIPAVRNHFSANVNIVIRASLNQNLLKTLPVVIPTENEQKEIANYLDSKHRSFTKLIDVMLKEINELKELKNTIISDVVTGKIDVRNVAIPEYEHIDDAADAAGGEESAEELAEAEEMEA